MVKLVDRYVGVAALLGTLLAWLALTVLFLMFSLLAELRATEGEYSTGDAVWFVLLTVPRIAYQVFPVSALMGALLGAGSLAASNELVAFRTSGVSRLRLSLAALAGTLVLALPVLVMGEWVAPGAEHQARAFRLSEMVGQAIIGGVRGMWLRDGNAIVNIQMPVLSANRGGQTVEFNDVVIYGFPEAAELRTITRAASASHEQDSWTLQDVTEISFGSEGAAARSMPEKSWATVVQPELLDSAVTRPKRLSIRSLSLYLDYLHENGLDDTVYLAAFWEKIVYPLTIVALVLAGMPFIFGRVRSHGVGLRLFFGIVLGGLFLILSRLAQNFADAYGLPALLSSLAPPLLLGAGALFALRRST